MSNQSPDPLNQNPDQTSHEAYTNELAKRAAKGDEAALKELLENPEFKKRVRAISVALANRHSLRESYKDARELEHDLYALVWKNITNLKGTASFNTWLNSVAKNLQIDRLRKKGRRHKTVVDRTDVGKGAVTSQFQTKGIALRETLDRLTDVERQVLTLKVEGASLHEIAQELGISNSQAHLKLRRILQRLQEIVPALMDHPLQPDGWNSLVEIMVESQDLETIFDESLGEIDEIRSRMSQAQLEIDQHKETTRNIIGQLAF